MRVLKQLGTQLGASQEQRDDWSRYWIRYGLETYTALITNTAGRFSFGDQPTAADCFLIPHLANADRNAVSLEDFALLQRIRESCLSLDAFIKAGPTVQPDSP
jgi:glutathione S-transferase